MEGGSDFIYGKYIEKVEELRVFSGEIARILTFDEIDSRSTLEEVEKIFSRIFPYHSITIASGVYH